MILGTRHWPSSAKTGVRESGSQRPNNLATYNLCAQEVEGIGGPWAGQLATWTSRIHELQIRVEQERVSVYKMDLDGGRHLPPSSGLGGHLCSNVYRHTYIHIIKNVRDKQV